MQKWMVTGLTATGYLSWQFYGTMASDRVLKFGAIISNMEVTKENNFNLLINYMYADIACFFVLFKNKNNNEVTVANCQSYIVMSCH